MFRLIFRMLLAGAIIWVVIIAIANLTRSKVAPKVDPALAGIVEEWRWDIESANLQYESAFNRLNLIGLSTDPDAKYAGVTEMGKRRILVTKRQIESGTYRARATVYHELGHFVFKLEHGSCRIMAEKCPSEEELKENWAQYVNEYLQLCINNSFEAKY